jgi:hypothetical protein
MSAQQNHGLTVVVKEGVRDSGGGVRHVAVACGGGERGGGGGEQQRATKAAAEACGGGVWLFSVTRDGTLRGDMKIYVNICPDINLQNVGGTFCKFVFL